MKKNLKDCKRAAISVVAAMFCLCSYSGVPHEFELLEDAYTLTSSKADSAIVYVDYSDDESSEESKTDSIESFVNLPAVEVVANRANSKTPVAFTNISKAELSRKNMTQDVPYLLQATPSVVATSDAGAGMGYTSMRIRGTDATRINVTINGIPINSSENHRTYWVNMPDLASSVHDVQVQRGVGTSTNGAGAFGASINMTTDLPSENSYAELNGAYGSYNTHRESLRVGSGVLGGYWSFDARISNLGTDGYIDRASANLWSYFGQAAYQNKNTTVRLVAFGGKEETYLAWNYATLEDMALYGRRYNPSGLYINSAGERAFYPEQKDRFNQHHFHLLINQHLGNYWRLNVNLHYTRDFGYYTQLDMNRTLSEFGLKPFQQADGAMVYSSDLIRKEYLKNRFGGAIFNLAYRRGRVNALLGGGINRFHGGHYGDIAWVRNYVGPINPDQRYYDFTGRKTDANLFVRTTVDLNRSFSAFADLQYRRIHYTIFGGANVWDYALDAPMPVDVCRNWNFFNPKFGVNFNAGPHRAFVSWSVAHKEPTADNFVLAKPEEYPRAERLFDYEAGYTFDHRLFSLGLNLYYMDYKDQLVLTGQLSDVGNPQSVNVDKSYRIGVELQGALRPIKWFDWAWNVTLSRNRIKNFIETIYNTSNANPIEIFCGNTPIAFSPAVTFNNSFNFNVKQFEASLQSLYVGRQYLSNARNSEAMLKAYFVSNLNLGYTFVNLFGVKQLRIGFAVNNLFNDKYFNNGYTGAYYTEDTSGHKTIHRYAGFAAQATTNVMATVNLKF